MMGKHRLSLFILLFLMHACHVALADRVTDETINHQYTLAISTLSSLSSLSSSMTGHSQPLLSKFYHPLTFINQLYEFVHGKFYKTYKSKNEFKNEGNLDNLKSPVISPNDSPTIKRSKAIQILHINAYEHHHAPSLMSLGNIFLLSEYQHPRNVTMAFGHYLELASYGNATAQRMVGLLYATGIGVERNYAKAQIYISFAALGEDLIAKQLLGYWHHMGIGVSKSCEEAAFYYLKVGEELTKMYLDGPPLGRIIPETPIKIPEKENHGIYGKGVSGAGDPNQKISSVNGAMTTRDVIEYLSLQSDSGDASAQVVVGQVYYQGAEGIPVDYVKARKYFQMAARFPQKSPTSSSSNIKSVNDKASIAGQAAGFLGQIYWRGEGVTQNNHTARKWYEKGADVHNAACLYALGVMNEHGIAGLKKDLKRALYYYVEAANKDNADALTRMGELKSSQDPIKAFSYFKKAASKGDVIASYKVGLFYLKGHGTSPNCQAGVTFLKNLVEKASWHEPFIHQAYSLYKARDYESSLIHYIFSGELGLEIAQTNAAWMLEKQYGQIQEVYVNASGTRDHYDMAHILWNRAANQGNVDARVKLGDYYFTGKLKSNSTLSGEGPDYNKAVLYYRVAAESEYSTLAMWNLGWMYENGLGVQQDFHLAKRMYDQCLSYNPGAYLPIRIALMKLYLKWLWLWIRGKAGPSRPFDKPLPPKTPNTHDSVTSEVAGEEILEESHVWLNDNVLILLLLLLGSLFYYWRSLVVLQPLPREPGPYFEGDENDSESDDLLQNQENEENQDQSLSRRKTPYTFDK